MAELLAPAGDLEKLKYAVAYGADSVYFGLDDFSLRNFAGNFNLDDAENGLRYLHENSRKGYVTLNIYPFSEEYEKLVDTACKLDEMGVDAIIVSDLGVMSQLGKRGIKAPVHVSTQANTVSAQTVLAWSELGAKRVNLARELSFEQIVSIQKMISGSGVETEVFIHGAVCFSYSGRCAISDYLSARRANRGECSHPCRWKYALVEEKRPGEYFPVVEDQRGLYMFNSRDLALYPYMRDLASVGVDSFKIEGRMKTIHYIANTVSFYRRILDGEDVSSEEAARLLGRVKNRGYSHGFMKGGVDSLDYNYECGYLDASATMLGNVLDIGRTDGRVVMEVRNKIIAGDEIEILSPGGSLKTARFPDEFETEKGDRLASAGSTHRVLLDMDLAPFSIVRKVTGEDNA